ncbi:MAG: bifunctional heptose 7-phosphate kinase/heptose 1-phosphate adenyltransferase [Legionellales bacterium]|nr:bifunctional heptose 7-phosphate kinase/heptose 1-phosphate adenyltransferase [Legionellales bacterium]OUX63766.1 MAG: D-glycero-beta-D-manno-heptose 1-phosphate adenylyltransferase [Gammaproteobacteria bacterium TMED281]
MQYPVSFEFHQPIYVIGDVMLDIYLEGNTTRISPEAPVPVLKYKNKRFALGGACNVAMNLQSLGATPIIYGLIGKDEHGEILTQLLNDAGIQNHLIVTNQPTITKMRLVDNHHQLLRIDYEEKFHQENSAQLIDHLNRELQKDQFCIISDYNKGTVHSPQSIISNCKHVVVDPKGDDFEKYSGAFLITPNLKEFQIASQTTTHDIEALNQLGQTFREKLNIKHLLITLSEQGMLLINQHQHIHEKADRTSHVSDVTGAGDTVIATLTAFLSINTPIDKSLQLSNLAAGIVVKTFGTTSVTKKDLLQELTLTSHGKIKELSVLEKIISKHKQAGKTIVFTNGCFDILHPGHIMLLQKAKALGDVLIVGINSDDSIKRLKGENRPINHLNARMNVLSGLEAVDFVTSFGSDTPLELIKAFEPNVLVKGGDYDLGSIVGAEEVKAAGGQVVIIPLHENYSTTSIVESLSQ